MENNVVVLRGHTVLYSLGRRASSDRRPWRRVALDLEGLASGKLVPLVPKEATPVPGTAGNRVKHLGQGTLHVSSYPA